MLQHVSYVCDSYVHFIHILLLIEYTGVRKPDRLSTDAQPIPNLTDSEIFRASVGITLWYGIKLILSEYLVPIPIDGRASGVTNWTLDKIHALEIIRFLFHWKKVPLNEFRCEIAREITYKQRVIMLMGFCYC